MCLRINRRKTTSAGVPCRPRLHLLGRRFARASYTVATNCSSAKTSSACGIQSSRKPRTSVAIKPSMKPSWARRILITAPPPGRCWRLIWTQQLVVELANRLDGLLQPLIVAKPSAHLGDLLAAQAELARAPARIAHGENRHSMPFAARAFGAALGVVTNGAREQRAAQQLAGNREPVEQPLAHQDGPLTSHSYR